MQALAIEAVRLVDLGAGSWLDLCRGWLPGAGDLYSELASAVAWRQGRVFRYERWIPEPRLSAGVVDVPGPAAAVLVEARRRLIQRYGVPLGRGGMAYYRDGRDSMAFHRDRDLRHLDDTVVAILTLGGPRPFALRPYAFAFAGGDVEDGGNRAGAGAGGGTPVQTVSPGPGDLLVMGGRCQADWQHSVPKQYRLDVPGRISVQWRWTSGRGRPVVGPSYRAPRTYRA
ncbi:MAG: alpha-ketoglutarate-dependent dioxygenase AlkB [Acidimicrobiales bacterium]